MKCCFVGLPSCYHFWELSVAFVNTPEKTEFCLAALMLIESHPFPLPHYANCKHPFLVNQVRTRLSSGLLVYWVLMFRINVSSWTVFSQIYMSGHWIPVLRNVIGDSEVNLSYHEFLFCCTTLSFLGDFCCICQYARENWILFSSTDADWITSVSPSILCHSNFGMWNLCH